MAATAKLNSINQGTHSMTVHDITLVQSAIHNPSEARHFMTITPIAPTISAVINNTQIAHSVNAVVVKEVARQIYDPVIYFPRADVQMALLEPTDRTTHCPLKGDTEYFDIVTSEGRAVAGAWSYVTMTLGDELKDLIAFDPLQADIS